MSFDERFPFCERVSDLHDHTICSRRLEAALDMQKCATQYSSSLSKRQELASQTDYWEALVLSWESLAESFDRQHLSQGWEEYLLAQSRMTRNAVMGVPKNQEMAFECEPSMRTLLSKLKSDEWMDEPTYHPHTRCITQAISDIVKSNDQLCDRLWNLYMSFPDEKNLLARLFASQDARTTSSALVLIMNLTNNSPSRLEKLASTPAGTHTCGALLDRIPGLLEASEDEESDEGRALHLAYTLFNRLFRIGKFEQLYTPLSGASSPLTPAQLVLLKLYDCHLHNHKHSQTRTHYHSSPLPAPTHLVRVLLQLSQSIRQLGGRKKVEPDMGQGLVLVAGCLNEVLLSEDERKGTDEERIREAMETEKGGDGQGVVESLIDLLRKLSSISPLAKPVAANGNDGHPDALAYVKLALVRLLSSLSHRSRSVQDRAREAGGIEVIVGLCGSDDRNPYLREHALFAIRNLSEGNEENTAAVEKFDMPGKENEAEAIKALALKESGKANANANGKVNGEVEENGRE